MPWSARSSTSSSPIADTPFNPSRMLPAALREELLCAAAEHASLKLAEIESRAHFVKDLER